MSRMRSSNRSGSSSASHVAKRSRRRPAGNSSTPRRISANEITLRNTRSSSTSASQETTWRSGCGLIHAATTLVSNTHNFTSRGLFLVRLILRPDPRIGEAAKNSARVALTVGFTLPLLGRHHDYSFLTFAGDGLGTIRERAVDHLAESRLGLGHCLGPASVALTTFASHISHPGHHA